MLTLLTTIPLLFAITHAPSLDPSATSDDETAEAPPPAVEQADFGAALEHLIEADQDANRNKDPVAASEALTEAITALEAFGPELAGDDEARRSRQFARLNLARTHLVAKNDALAEQIMDEAIREAMDDELPAAEFGPSLERLYESRMAALEELGRASLVVNCGMDCKVYVDERELGPEPPPLLLGSYRVWVEDTTGKRSLMRERVELSEADQVYELEFAVIRPAKPPAPPPAPYQRMMPRWTEVALTVVGVGLTTTGAVLLGLHGGDKPGPGAICLGLGIATFIPGVITLSVDERRLAGKTERQAMVGWTLEF